MTERREIQRRAPFGPVLAMFAALVASFLAAAPAGAAGGVCAAGNAAADPVVAQVEAVVAPKLGPHMPGISIAVVTATPGNPSVPLIQLVNCGKVGPDAGAPAVSASTQWEIGSETKLFTATALAQMQLDGSIDAGDRVQDFSPVPNVPWSVCPQAPTPPAREMQLRDLVTHSSGLNNGPGGENPKNLTWATDPEGRADYSQEDLWQSFTSNAPGTVDTQSSCQALAFDPGTAYQYSNWGFALLGTILANRHAPAVAGVPDYQKLVNDYVTGPLWMQDTTLEYIDPLPPSTLAVPTCTTPSPCYYDNHNAYAGAGGLLSTIGDLGTFVAANLGFNPNPQVTPALLYTHQLAFVGPAAPVPDPPPTCSTTTMSPGCDYLGFAWQYHVSQPLQGFPFEYLHKDGGTNGFHSHTYLMPKACFGLSLASNSDDPATVADLAHGIAGLYFAPPPSTYPPCGADPGAASAVSATAGKQSATVSWTPPSSDGGSPVAGYIVTATPGGQQCATATATSCTVEHLTAGVPHHFTVHAFTARGGSDSSPSNAVTPWSGSAFHSVTPFRALDSRTDTGGWHAPLAAGAPRSLLLAGVGPVPATASAAVLNVTATQSSANTFLTVYPTGGAVPDASNLNVAAGETIPNLVTVPLGAGGAVDLATAVGSTDVVADVVGYYDDGTGPGELFNGADPTRILDSRTTNGGWNQKLGAGDAAARTLQVRGRGGVPSTATAVVLNVTATNADHGSFVQVWPTGQARPVGSNLNFAAGETIPNLVVTPLGAGGQVSFANEVGATDLTADVMGWFDPTQGSRFHALAGPTRILDDRVGTGLTGPWGPDQARTLVVTGANGIPVGATALVVNTTVTGGSAATYVTVYPTGVARPATSNLNAGPGQTIANLVMVAVPAAGAIDLHNLNGTVDVVGDAAGYFAVT